MDERYDSYCATDPLFYDSLASVGGRTPEFPAVLRPVPDGWQREPSDDWLIYGPIGGSLPQQGWKVHLSACLDNAERILDVAWDYCVPRGLPFKFLRSPRMLLLRNAKYARRGSSGKFVTIYPRDEAELELVCKELDKRLRGEPGPYILSDLRYGTGPVYLRYGGFAARYCLSADGEVVPAIADDSGTLVPDRRNPVFHLPDWVRLPGFLTPHLAARNAASTNDLPYRIDRVIHFSNGGGLYVAHDTRTGTHVVLKEARPHAGLDATGTDAVTRLAREGGVLRRLDGVARVPRVHDEFRLGDHSFLALEFVEGRPLNKVLVERYPLIDTDATEADLAAYTEWALEIHRKVTRAISAIHAHDIVHGDLHLFNVMVRPDDEITLLDFEVAAPAAETHRPGLRNQGFAAPRDRTGTAVDRYALACLRLALFLPLTPLVRLAPAKARHLADVICRHFPVPREEFDEAVAEINDPAGTPAEKADNSTDNADGAGNADSAVNIARAGVPRAGTRGGTPVDDDPSDLDVDPGSWPRLRKRLANAIIASVTAQRDDRLFPGDIAQFRSGGLNLAHGAAGVLHALATTGAGRYPEYERWLTRRALNAPSGSRCGLYDGLHGVAFALERLDRRQNALDVLDLCLRQPWENLGLDLVGGLSGIALNLADFAARTGEVELTAAARRAAELVAYRLRGDDPASDTATGDDPHPGPGSVTESAVSGGRHPYAGLARGRTGAALMFLRLYEVTGDAELLDRAAAALRHDLRRCVLRPDGVLEVNEGWRTMPYLADGSVGIGMVLDQFLRHRPEDRQLRHAATAIRLAARSPFYAQSGLFAGRAGIVAYLAARTRAEASQTGPDRRELTTQIRRLSWHAMPYAGWLAFPGDQLLRLSMDLATGTAGVLLAVGSALHDEPVALPFLTPLTGATGLPPAPRTGATEFPSRS
jgi:tRNA A-37 threonylcarbamoyl transferase component Bud32